MGEGVNVQGIGAGRIWGALTAPGNCRITRTGSCDGRKAVSVRCPACDRGLWLWEDQAEDDGLWANVLDMINQFLGAHRWHEEARPGVDAPEAPPAKRNVIAEADRIINSDRPSKYGKVEDSFGRIAEAFNAVRPHGGPFTAEDVARLLVCMKLVRDGYSPSNPDHVLDAIGYLGLLDQLRQSRPASLGVDKGTE